MSASAGVGGGDISIHASREGSDVHVSYPVFYNHDFNPRFPRGKRLNLNAYSLRDYHFNPRFPRRKRPAHYTGWNLPYNFNPRFPRGKRPRILFHQSTGYAISIHASREGSDIITPCFPVGVNPISIHASREGSDAAVILKYTHTATISIHASREGSDRSLSVTFPPGRFQSTLPAREATSPSIT